MARAWAPSCCAAAAVLLGGTGALCVPRARAAPVPSRPTAREVRLLMGTPAEVAAVGAHAERAVAAAFAALQRVDDEMTLWRPSPLTRLNVAGRAVVSRDLFTVLSRALEVAADSGGAFDPTVEPLVRAAGQLGEPARPLGPPERRDALRRVGAPNVQLDAASREVRLLQGARLDLGGIAKGFAADRALAALAAAGTQEGLVDLGGSSVAVFGAPLEVAVADPRDRAAPPWASFRLRAPALGTSGPSERGPHIFDPHTGEPAARVLSATVVAASAMEADALSTAVFVLGAREGLALLARRGAAGFVLTSESGRPVLASTPGFARAHALRAAPGVLVRGGP